MNTSISSQQVVSLSRLRDKAGLLSFRNFSGIAIFAFLSLMPHARAEQITEGNFEKEAVNSIIEIMGHAW